MRGALVDCFAGVSGDMLLGAIVDAGVPLAELQAGLANLPVQGWSLAAEPFARHAVRGTRVRVRLDDVRPQPTRHLSTVEQVIRSGSLPDPVPERACAVFRRLAEAEAHVHATTVEQVHFHEVGAVDAIVDVVGVVLGLHLLGVAPAALHATGLPLGSGWTRSAHGRLPVPAPATMELIRLAGAPTRRDPIDAETGELSTPTGAALVTVLASFEPIAFRHVETVAHGFGTREPAWPNALRLLVGELDAPGQPLRDTVAILETNLDDTTPEALGYAMEVLLANGALDVSFSPLQMKKNRPGVLLSVLAPPPLVRTIASLVLAHTSALGVRVQEAQRYVAERAARTVQTPWGPVRLKEKRLGATVSFSPEFEDCAALARTAGVPLAAVYEAAREAATRR